MNYPKTKILLIEDDRDLSKKIELFLTKKNYFVIIAFTGHEGLNIVFRNPPDLIICDIMLPDIDGYRVLQKIKKNKNTAILPFLFLTAKADMEDLRKGMNLGADDYLTKPFRINDLIEAIEVRLQKNRQLHEIIKMRSNTVSDSLSESNQIFFKIGNKISKVKPKNIVCILSEGNYSYIYTIDGKKYILRKLLKEWENIFDFNKFVRIHRSTIINLNYINKIKKTSNSELHVYLDHFDNALKVSRKYRKNIAKFVIT